MKTIVVAAALLEKNGQILLAKRRKNKFMSGFWELPGGKLEIGEQPHQTLMREANEELGIICRHLQCYHVIYHRYPDREITLYIYRVKHYDNAAIGKEGQDIEWVNIERLNEYQLLPTMQTLIHTLTLPKVMWITPGNVTLDAVTDRLKAGVRLVQLRSDKLLTQDFVTSIFNVCQRYHAKLMLNLPNSLELLSFGDGIHLKSAALAQVIKRPIAADKLLSAAAHTIQELDKANALGVDFALLSPVLNTPTHPDASALGWQLTQQLVENAKLPVMLLGGLSPRHLSHADNIGAIGIAGIRLNDAHY